MLRGISTMNLWADDLPAATRWYTELLGVEPYFTSEAAGRGPGYVEFRIGDYQHELGIIDRRFAPPGLAAALAGRSSTGTSTRWPQPWTGWSGWVPSHSSRSPSAAPGSSPPRSSTPSATSWGIMHNGHYLDILASRG
jgi:catechol 2,3-dioxygenase-like lactoylglutathione lyase family enzyme